MLHHVRRAELNPALSLLHRLERQERMRQAELASKAEAAKTAEESGNKPLISLSLRRQPWQRSICFGMRGTQSKQATSAAGTARPQIMGRWAKKSCAHASRACQHVH